MSAAEHPLLMQSVEAEMKLGFAHEHEKSVKPQPVAGNAPARQVRAHCGKSPIPAPATTAARVATTAVEVNFILID